MYRIFRVDSQFSFQCSVLCEELPYTRRRVMLFDVMIVEHKKVGKSMCGHKNAIFTVKLIIKLEKYFELFKI